MIHNYQERVDCHKKIISLILINPSHIGFCVNYHCYVGHNAKYSNKLREDGSDCDKDSTQIPQICSNHTD